MSGKGKGEDKAHGTPHGKTFGGRTATTWSTEQARTMAREREKVRAALAGDMTGADTFEEAGEAARTDATPLVGLTPKRLERVALTDMKKQHGEVVRLLRKKLSPSQTVELQKVRLALNQALLDRTAGRPRQQPTMGAALPDEYAAAVKEAQRRAAEGAAEEPAERS